MDNKEKLTTLDTIYRGKTNKAQKHNIRKLQRFDDKVDFKEMNRSHIHIILM
jgi:hypothetical protein